MNYLWFIYIACLIAGTVFLIAGMIQFSDPYKSKNWFFLGALFLLTPVLLALIIITIEQLSQAKASPSLVPYGFIVLGIIMIAAVFIARFGSAIDRAARNATLACSAFFFIMLVVVLFSFTMASIEPPIPGEQFGDFKYVEESGQITITHHSGDDKAVEIPSVINGKSVTKIDYEAFTGNGMSGVVIPDSITTMDARAFFDCDSLMAVTIPDSVTSIGYDAFGSCNVLTEINVSSGNPKYSSLEGLLYSKDMKTLISCPTGKSGSVTLPDTVTYIGDGAFGGCSKLTSITIPNSATISGANAFAGCSAETGTA